MKLHFAAKTDVGLKRKVNEDCVYVNEKIGLCAVADGMGGHSAGDVASRMVIDIVEESFSDFEPTDDESIREVLNETIQLANYAVKTSASQNPEQRGMGSTITLLYFYDDKYYIAQVGDSRAYLIRENQIFQITEDHSLVQQELDKGLITEEEAEAHVFKNIITRAIGIREDVEVDFYSDRIMKGDTFILCTDSLTNKVSNLDLLKEITVSKPLEDIVDDLIDLANDRDGSDNISLILVSTGKQVKEKSPAFAAPVGNKRFLIPVLGVVILGILATGYYFLFMKKDDGVQVAQNASSQTEQMLPEHIGADNTAAQLEPTADIQFDMENAFDDEASFDDTPARTNDINSDELIDTQETDTERFALTPIPTPVPTKPTPIKTIPPTRVPSRPKPTSLPTKPPVDRGFDLQRGFGMEMGEDYRDALQALYRDGIDEASSLWNKMLYKTSAKYTCQIEVDTLEKSVFTSFERYGDYNLFVIKKRGRFYVYAGLFSSRNEAEQAITLLPEVIQERPPFIKRISQIRLSR